MGVVLCIVVPQAFAAWTLDLSMGVQTAIQTRIGALPEATQGDPEALVKTTDQLVREFYAHRNYRPAWTAAQAEVLLKVLREAGQEGLNPNDYDLEASTALIATSMNAAGGADAAERQADLDIFLTSAFLNYGRHLSHGRLDPEKWFFQWVPHHRTADVLHALQEGLEKNDIETNLKALAPRHPSYVQMRQELQNFRRIAANGGWPLLTGAGAQKRGDRGHSVVLLKRRMIMMGDLRPALLGHETHFDAALDEAVRRFQWRHGLVITGVVDRETRAALNVPVEQRIRQIEINMERWRWLPDDFGSRYVMTIIPDLWLYVVDDQKTIMSMKTVIGTPKQPSPVFSDEMSYLELNPTWGLPNSIVAKEIIPKVRKDPEYLTKKHIRLYQNWSDKAKEVDPKKIDWAKINPERFPYRMVQDSGVNPLGRIKFMFPNDFDVYLHDTTQKGLFSRQRRLFSHGCIRIEKPYALGEWVLRDNPSWNRERLVAEIKKGKRVQVNLQRPVPVHVMYLTAWVDGNGILQFRQDYYGYDSDYEEALKKIGQLKTGTLQSTRVKMSLGTI